MQGKGQEKEPQAERYSSQEGQEVGRGCLLMPVKKCKAKGKSGYKYGSKGKCYTGKGGRKKAAKQGQAIKSRTKRY